MARREPRAELLGGLFAEQRVERGAGTTVVDCHGEEVGSVIASRHGVPASLERQLRHVTH